MKPIPHANCPQCGELRAVRNKLLATNLFKGGPYIEAFEVNDREKFQASPYAGSDYFVDALFCRSCEIAFIPDAVAAEMGIAATTHRGALEQPRPPLGLGAIGDPG